MDLVQLFKSVLAPVQFLGQFYHLILDGFDACEVLLFHLRYHLVELIHFEVERSLERVFGLF